MSRTEKITDIIEKRRPLAKKIAAVQGNLESLLSAIGQLEAHRQRLINDTDVTDLDKLDFLSVQENIQQEHQQLEILEKRFSRPTLNIGVVGLMGQGKSTLLKTLSGLRDKEIPAYEGSACTAVRSTIVNYPGETTAEVTLHSEKSFLQEVIYPYYEKLGFTNKPFSLNDFAKSPLPQIQPGIATDEQMYKHLHDDYYINIAKYKDLLQLGNPRQLRINRDEITDYVMQRRDAHGQLKTFKHLATREVKIFCQFENPDVGNIALVDIPGLGDSKLGDEDLMLQTLGEDVDFVLFIRRPDPQRYQWKPEDTILYDTAAKALNNLSNRSFMILNHSRRIDNLNACREMQGNLGTIKVVKSEIADCSNHDEANQVFDLVLDYLVREIYNLDREYAASRQEKINQLQNEISKEIKNACNVFAKKTPNTEDFALFTTKFKRLWSDLTNHLKELLKELRQKREEIDVDFKTYLESALKACREDTKVPSIKEIETKNNEMGGYGSAYEYYLNDIRAHLSKNFLSLDEGLKISLDRVKSQVADVLIQKGSFGNLTEVRGADFIAVIAEKIPDELIPGEASKIKFGFQMLAEFVLSYRGFIQHRIRQHLDVLTPNEAACIALPNVPTAEQIQQSLKAAHAEAIYKCQEPLESLLSEPNQAAFAIVEEFFDRIFRATDAENEWQIFLYDIRLQIWDEFQQLNEQAQVQQQWLKSVEKVEAFSQANLVNFLN
ncbi:MAG: dynamin family protein [Scytonematopsis contorta HA4267-MV1]|jgi:energy-coupling factor transporter ATP-binding protein EcfA2|nr:dynamin family protein [Scytonematopsis contorta HA4267-MV1]